MRPLGSPPEVYRMLLVARLATMKPRDLHKMREFLEREMAKDGALSAGSETEAARLAVFLLRAAEREARARKR